MTFFRNLDDWEFDDIRYLEGNGPRRSSFKKNQRDSSSSRVEDELIINHDQNTTSININENYFVTDKISSFGLNSPDVSRYILLQTFA